MRIHGDAIKTGDLYDAAKAAGVTLTRTTMHGSRKRAQAFDVTLEGNSRRAPNGGSSGAGTGKAATWDQWGIFLDVLFNADDTLTIPRVYEDRFQFDYRTSYRFEGGEAPDDMHGDHRFQFIAPYMFQCTKCSAVQRNK